MFATEPLSIGGTLDAGFRIYRQTFVSVMQVAALGAALMVVANLIGTTMIDYEAAYQGMAAGDMSAVGSVYGVSAVGMVFFLFFFILVANRQFMLASGQAASVSDDLITGLKLIVPLTIMTVVYWIAVTIGLVLLVIPGLIIAITMAMFVFVPIVERGGAWSSLLRSHRLVWRGNWFRTATVLTVVGIVLMVLSLLFSVFIVGYQGITAFTQPTTPTAISIVLGGVISMIIYPLPAAVGLTLYNDIRLRKEGGDLDSRLASLDSE